MLDEETKKNLTNFVLQLYMKQRPKSETTLGALTWHVFSIHQSEWKTLPPTHKAFRQMLMRNHFTALQWKSSHLVSPVLPDPNDLKCVETKKIFEPVMAKNPMIQGSIMELVSRRYQTDRCFL